MMASNTRFSDDGQANPTMQKEGAVSSRQHIHDLDKPLRARLVLVGIMLALFILVVWAAIGKIDQVTRAQAVLVAADRTQLVQSSDGGVLTELMVKEGQHVKAGQ